MCQACGCGSNKVEKQVLQIEGMTCSHCKSAVEKAVRGLPGVLAAEVDLAAKTLAVEFDAKKSPLASVKSAVEEAGYKVVAD
jgi:copper chaperone